MPLNQDNRPPLENPPSSTKQAGKRNDPRAATPAPQALPYQPGVSPSSVDVTGVVPEDVRVDPDITEGHPGYEETGDSEIHPSR